MAALDEAIIKRVLPHSIEAEQAVVGSMLMDKDAILTCSELISGEDFYQKAYGVIFTNIREQLPSTNEHSDHILDKEQGYIYVMINQSLPNIVKIGKTTRDPNERAKELSAATGVPTPFMLIYYKEFSNCHIAERVIHQYLEEQGKRVNNNREFFYISTMEAIQLIDKCYQVCNE